MSKGNDKMIDTTTLSKSETSIETSTHKTRSWNFTSSDNIFPQRTTNVQGNKRD